MNIRDLIAIKAEIDRLPPAPGIVYTLAAEERTDEPARRYKRRRWQTAAQAARKQKKWIRRWGWKYRPAIFVARAAGRKIIVAHPVFEEAIERARKTVGAPAFGPPGLPDLSYLDVEPKKERDRFEFYYSAFPFAIRRSSDFGVISASLAV